MDTSSHTLETLFAQLGLPNSETAITAFVENNHLPRDIPLENAAFWSASQAQMLRESIVEDSDWAEVVDLLNAQLHAES